MFAPVVLGSNKTTVSVATGQNEYYSLYALLGNVQNHVRRWWVYKLQLLRRCMKPMSNGSGVSSVWGVCIQASKTLFPIQYTWYGISLCVCIARQRGSTAATCLIQIKLWPILEIRGKVTDGRMHHRAKPYPHLVCFSLGLFQYVL